MKTSWLQLFCFVILLPALQSCGGSSGSDDTDSEVSSLQSATISGDSADATFARWVDHMRVFGNMHCTVLTSSSASYDERLGATYYDALWVYQQIRSFTGDSGWDRCIDASRSLYRDSFVLNANGQVPGYWNFSHGLRNDVTSAGVEKSRVAIAALIEHAAFSGIQTPLAWTLDAELSREVAYTIMTYLNAKVIGLDFPEQRLFEFVEQSFGHIQQWTSGNAPYVRPFMVALTAQALIEYHNAYGDPAVIPAVSEALDFIWRRAWIPGLQTFRYTDREHSSGGTEPAPDLNLLIAPAYMWLALHTGSTSWFQRAEAIFAGGVQGAYLGGAKQFNQNYRWSFQYMVWKNSYSALK